ncbi:Pleiotropic negative transcriptional regulator [Cladochytrium tenue]|nr:Pleiotropic negative transcriptional regulator [Cladochytrium tenue]
MMPGLSAPGQVYQFQINYDVYQFSIYNASKVLSDAEEAQEWDILRRFYQKTGGLRLTVLGSIAAARGFQRLPSSSSSLYVRYAIDADEATWTPGTCTDVLVGPDASPDNVATARRHQGTVAVVRRRADQLSAYTQASDRVFDEDTGAWEARFGHPLEFEMTTARYGAGGRLEWPTVYFEVCSMDYWDRHVVEGYTYAKLPRQPG